MTPPAAPCRVDMRRIACPAHRKAPTTLTANMATSRSWVISSTRAGPATMPALLTSAATGPMASAAMNSAATASGEVTSVGTATAATPAASHSATTRPADSAAARKPMQTSQPWRASRIAVAAPIPRLPPVTTATLRIRDLPD